MQQPVDRTATPYVLLQLSLVTGLTLLPHGMNLTLAVNLYLILLLGWRIASLRLPRIKPGRWLLLLATLGGVLLVYTQYRTLIGRDAGVALLAVMLLLKVMEANKQRDIYVSVFIAYFVLVTHFLFNQSLLLSLYLLLVMVCLTALLLEINRVTASPRPYQPLIKTLLITLQAFPIALILFVVFPRITQPLWSLGNSATAMTGLSDRVTPGAISQLIESAEVAFRAEFKQSPPVAEQRYWRGLVLWDTDGYSWYTDPRQPLAGGSPEITMRGESYVYNIFLEPHNRTWLYSLDLPISAPTRTRLSRDFQLWMEKPLTRPLRYTGHSATDYRTPELSLDMRQRALRLSDNLTQRQRDLVSRWQATASNDSQLVEMALGFFNSNPFIYTLTPPVYLNNPIDEFLFEGREGFCEHYATSFTQLMRLAGIPARLVVGYQGGEYNQLGDYFIVRQYDAHAWSEVWLAQQGWVRVDPTAAVAPERVRYSIRSDFGEEGSPALFRTDNGGVVSSLFRQLGLALDNANVQWRHWVIGYSREHQFSLMRGLGFDFLSPTQWSLITTGMIAASLLIVGLRITWQGKRRATPIQAVYRRFCRRLSRLGIDRLPYEGPIDFATRASRRRPDLAAQIQRITALYIRLRYGPHGGEADRRAFTTQVRLFRPPRRYRKLNG
ncbi:MAG: DUF3488 and transglutaminase-like domain-containing protein [Candidatus Thiodiazotropha sp. (ex Epidulcina cf. delphinae)]|nr:DUF3488 and transglutaminase-like domain-containing protein [Candidatus Thiodiazotropha sp. (ex Epidulcina cf. delphinae)]